MSGKESQMISAKIISRSCLVYSISARLYFDKKISSSHLFDINTYLATPNVKVYHYTRVSLDHTVLFYVCITVGDMLAVFSYMTLGALITALCCGFLYDYLRKRYLGKLVNSFIKHLDQSLCWVSL